MRAKNNFPGIPRQTKRNPTQDAVSESIEVLTGQRGNGDNRAVLLKDLINLDALTAAQFRKVRQSSTNDAGLPIVVVGGVEAPHAPINFTGVGGFTFIALMWDHPTYSGHAYTEIYRSDDNVFTNAVRIGTEVSDIFSDPVNMGVGYYYWARFVNDADVRGPTQGANGLYVETQQSAEAILAELGGQIEASHLGAFLTGEVGQIPDLAFDIDQSRLAAEEVLLSNGALAADLLTSSSANDTNWTTAHTNIAKLESTIDGVSASVTTDYYTKIAADAAISIANTTLKSTIEDANGDSIGATLQQLSYTTASNYGDFNALWGVRTDVTGITASFGLVNDGVDPIFAIKGAKFAIITDQDPTVVTPVFAVVNGKTVIKEALIDDAYIKSLVTDDLLSGRITVSSELKTPSINYNQTTGVRSQNFSLDPNGNMLAKSAVLESVTIKDNLGNVVMSSTGAIPKDNISGLGSLASQDSVALGDVAGAGPFAGLTKLLSTNMTTYIEAGAIGSAQIDQAYIGELFGDNASFTGEVFAEKITGDLVDGDVVSVTAAPTSVNTWWSTIKTISVERNNDFDVWLKIDDLTPTFYEAAGFGALYTQLKYDVQTGKAVLIPAGVTDVIIEIQVKKSELINSEVPVDTEVPTQNAILQMFRKGSGFIV